MASAEIEILAVKAVLMRVLDQLDAQEPIPGVGGRGQVVIRKAATLSVGDGQDELVALLGEWLENRDAMMRPVGQ
jgi:hypothetical protein